MFYYREAISIKYSSLTNEIIALNNIRCTNKRIALTHSLLPDLGRRWQPLGLTDEGWRSLYCIMDKARKIVII